MVDTMLTAEQRDALQEIANLAMGRAAARLALLFGTFIELSVPRVRVVRSADVCRVLRDMTGIDDNVTAVRQGFRSDIKGEALMLCRSSEVERLALLFDAYDDDEWEALTQAEFVFDVANVLMGACVSAILDELGRTPVFSPPGLLGADVTFDDVFPPNVLAWRETLLLEVNFGVADDSFRPHFVMLLAEDSIHQMSDALDSLLSSL
ncbi:MULTISPECIES: chemotaxis protein CheC [Burkholderia]|uniref:chemotaxis protein CheC n=1 Tax=Burkholderia TaxID=32008 RepID=UPI00084126C9|nr:MULTISPECIES: chemotaxis protein CheC [unclassified Burkholderia]AOK31176.1 chemotaxis protein [Burkholderia sp. Bp7605]